VEKKGAELYQITLGGSGDENTSIGEIIGRMLAMFPITPCSIRLCKAGISPRSRSGLMICQSAPSQPISSSFFAKRCDDIPVPNRNHLEQQIPGS